MLKDISAPIRYLKGIGPKRAELFNRLGINSAEDLIYYFPRRYEDRSMVVEISRLKPGEYQTVKARVLGCGQRKSFRRWGFAFFEAVVEDETGKLPCVWFNQPYLGKYLKPETEVVLYGKLEARGDSLQMRNPEYEILSHEDKDHLSYARIVPIYPLAEGLSQRMFRKVVRAALTEYLPVLRDTLPYDIRQRNKLENIASAILNMHFPQDITSQENSYKRIIFEECFLLQLLFGLKRLKSDKLIGISHSPDQSFLNEFEKTLSFALTRAQRRVISEIEKDMASLKPMHRLLQGDVGSGKTVVALYGCLSAVASGHQAAFMAPTEILAEQHYHNLGPLASGLNLKGRAINAALLTGSLNKKEREKIYKGVKSGKVDILVGTHALIREGLEFKRLSFVVIDEQHKFGVHQRLSMLTKGANPDCLIMTATPIPRTLAMTVYADLDISVIDELPRGRLAVKTHLAGEDGRLWVYDFIRENMRAGRQAYIVYPIIDESRALDLKAASTMYQELKKNVFPDFKVGLIHGKIKQKERARVMRAFKDGKINLLVSTVVIEVGIDIANASVMVIEQAERFGLSQLHQLRGRIGRGEYESHCILISDSKTQDASFRLRAMAEESDGFKIADRDLEIRGPGEFFGVRQHGLPELRVNPFGNLECLNTARQEARMLLSKDPLLTLRQNLPLADTLKNRFPEYDALMRA